MGVWQVKKRTLPAAAQRGSFYHRRAFRPALLGLKPQPPARQYVRDTKSQTAQRPQAGSKVLQKTQGEVRQETGETDKEGEKER